MSYIIVGDAVDPEIITQQKWSDKSYKKSYVTRSDKTSLIARKYTHPYNGIYLLFCVCYSNSVSFIDCLGFTAYMVKFVLKYLFRNGVNFKRLKIN